MKKKLKDLTISDYRKYCKKTHCKKCILYGDPCYYLTAKFCINTNYKMRAAKLVKENIYRSFCKDGMCSNCTYLGDIACHFLDLKFNKDTIKIKNMAVYL